MDDPQLEERLSRLDPQRRREAEAALLARGIKLPRPVPRLERNDDLVPSPWQAQLWAHAQIFGGDQAYVEGYALDLEGRLDLARLKSALDQIISRQSALRSVFRHTTTGPRVDICSNLALELDVIDVEQAPFDERESELELWTRRTMAEPFDLANGPIFRVRLLKLSSTRWRLLLAVHHIIWDEWSAKVFLGELKALYESQANELPELPISYYQHAAWLAALPAEEAQAFTRYWVNALFAPAAGDPGVSVRRPGPGGTASVTEVPVGPALVELIGKVSHAFQATRFEVLIGTLAVLTHRTNGERRVCIASPFSGRDDGKTEFLIGFFSRMLPLEFDFAGDPSFVDILGQARRIVADARANQDVPPAELARFIRTGAQNIVFSLQNSGEKLKKIGDLSAHAMPISNDHPKYPLNIEIVDDLGGSSNLRLIFDNSIYQPDEMAAHGHRYLDMIGQCLDRPSVPVGSFPLAECQQPRSSTQRFPGPTVLDRFRQAARRRPGSAAISAPDGSVTYQELDVASDEIAARLVGAGVARGDLVAAVAERSTRGIAWMIGTMKAGGVYLPLDPEAPQMRLSALLEDSKARFVIGDAIPVSEERQIIDFTDGPLGAVAISPTGRDLAYVMYTSGSTGRPKGVQITHDNLARIFGAVQGEYDVREDDVFSCVHSLTFDVSMFEIWAPLVAGAQLVMADRNVARAPEELTALLAETGVTALSMTPSAFKQFVDGGQGLVLPTALRLVILEGEPVDLASVDEWFRRHGDQRPMVFNMYGPTETTIHTTWCRLNKECCLRPNVSPLGRALPDMAVYLLDAHLHPVPDGLVGEAYIGGDGVGQGYLGRPGLSAERFLPDPYTKLPGARMYRTGDLMRRDPHGELEFVGRADFQLKLRGFRIEPGEIEGCARGHPLVRDCLVTSQTHRGRQRLICYVAVAAEGAHNPETWLRGHLAERLPEYMVPSVFVAVERFELTKNGKRDRAALPVPPDTPRGGSGLPPVTEMERVLAAIWREILTVDQVARDDNFFALGGDSMSALQLVARAREQGLPMQQRDPFDRPILLDLALGLDSGHADQHPAGRRGPKPYDLSQAQLMMLDRAACGSGIPWRTLNFELPDLNPQRLESAFASVFARHELLRVRVWRDATEWRAWSDAADWSPKPEVLASSDSIIASLRERLSVELPSRQALVRLFVGGDGATTGVTLAVNGLVADWPVLVDAMDELKAYGLGQSDGASDDLGRSSTPASNSDTERMSTWSLSHETFSTLAARFGQPLERDWSDLIAGALGWAWAQAFGVALKVHGPGPDGTIIFATTGEPASDREGPWDVVRAVRQYWHRTNDNIDTATVVASVQTIKGCGGAWPWWTLLPNAPPADLLFRLEAGAVGAQMRNDASCGEMQRLWDMADVAFQRLGDEPAPGSDFLYAPTEFTLAGLQPVELASLLAEITSKLEDRAEVGSVEGSILDS